MHDQLNEAGCKSKDVDVATDFVRSIVQNMLDLICGEYDDGSDKCTQLGNYLVTINK